MHDLYFCTVKILVLICVNKTYHYKVIYNPFSSNMSCLACIDYTNLTYRGAKEGVIWQCTEKENFYCTVS